MKIAVVGLGPHGRRMVSLARSMAGVSLHGVADLREDALLWPELSGDLIKTTRAEELWRDGAVDAVCITTNGPSHASLAISAMRAGVKRVLVEKPMACSVAECKSMIEVADATGARLSVNQSRRHDPFYRWLCDQIQTGCWGELRSVWIQRPGIGLGCLGTHYFDLIRFLSGMEATRATAWIDAFIGPNPRGEKYIDPGGLVVVELSGGVRGIVNQVEDGAGPMSVEVDLTSARVRIDERFGDVEIVERDRTVAHGPDRPVAYDKKPLPPGLSAKTNVTEMARGVLTELLGDGPMACDARHGLAAMEILTAAYASHERGHIPVSLELTGEDEKRWLPIT